MSDHHKLYGLIGFPLSHSFSGNYFAEKFSKAHIKDCTYNLYPITSIDMLPELLSTNRNLCGLNVTIPYKESVLPYLTRKSPAVEEIGACNCIHITGQELIGYNTDVIGFEKMILPHLRSHHNKALILGTGGAAKAVAWVLHKLGIDYMYVSRNPIEKGIQYALLDKDTLEKNTLIINTTPLGMSPHVEAFPDIPYAYINEMHLCIDLIYNPAKTKFLANAESRGAAIVNGLEMLIIQAEESWTIWNTH